jgi:hypothetical protein
VTQELAIQLGVSALMMLVMTLVHGIGLFSISRVLKLKDDHLEEQEFNFESILRMCGIAMLLFALHTLEIWIFAVVYLVVAMQSLEEALYYSASAYATLGRTADYFPQDWRLLGAMEALIGFLMIGWSTAFIVSKVNKMRK